MVCYELKEARCTPDATLLRLSMLAETVMTIWYWKKEEYSLSSFTSACELLREVDMVNIVVGGTRNGRYRLN
jgi:hypothetical protein